MLHRDFRKHPYPIISICCLIDSIYFFNYIGNIEIINSDIIEFFQFTKMIPEIIWEHGPLNAFGHFVHLIEHQEEVDFYDSLRQMFFFWKYSTLLSVFLSMVANGLMF